MKKVVVTGSIAYDHLMTYDGNLKDSIHNDSASLSVAFTTNSHKLCIALLTIIGGVPPDH